MKNLNDDKSTIPKYLEELVKPTPLSVAKLISVWDGLSVETQIIVLTEYLNHHPKRYLRKFLCIADKSNNLYVKHLVANIKNKYYLFDSVGDDDFGTKIVLKSNLCEGKIVSSKSFDGKTLTPKLLFENDYNTILKFICNFSKWDFRFSIPEFITYYYLNKTELNRFSEDDIFDFLSEYFDSTHFRNSFGISPLWQISEYGNCLLWSCDELRIEVKLIWNLLKYAEGDTINLIKHNLPNLDNKLVETFFELYKTIEDKWIISSILKNNKLLLFGVRKSIFESNNYDLETRFAAANANLNISHSDFGEIINKPNEIRIKLIYILNHSEDIDFCILWATVDFLNSSIVKKFLENDKDYLENNLFQIFGVDNISFRLTKISDYQKRIIVNRLRIYEISKLITPWKLNIEDDLSPSQLTQIKFPKEIDFLNTPIKTDSTWEQFEHFMKCWDSAIADKPHLENVLECFWSLEMNKYTCRLLFFTTIPQSSFNVTSFNILSNINDNIKMIYENANDIRISVAESKTNGAIRFEQIKCTGDSISNKLNDILIKNEINLNNRVNTLFLLVSCLVSLFIGFVLCWIAIGK
jgi:hypothetical protein